MARNALKKLRSLLRNGHSALKSIPEDDVPASEVMDAMETYLWHNGLIGDLDAPSRVINLTETAIAVTSSLPIGVRYPANILTHITNYLGVYNANKLIADGGTLQTIIDQKDIKRDLLIRGESRVRHHYCAGGDEGEYTVELALIDMQPKRLPGDAQPQPFPDAAGTATLDSVLQTLTLIVKPAHATSVVAFRKVPGGEPEQAGVSQTNVVGVADFSPPLPGIPYEMWVAGRNYRGFGPESNRITHTW